MDEWQLMGARVAKYSIELIEQSLNYLCKGSSGGRQLGTLGTTRDLPRGGIGSILVVAVLC